MVAGMKYTVGIDPSLSSTGVCVFDTETMQTFVAQIDGHHKDCHVGERCHRIAWAVDEFISRTIGDAVLDGYHVFIEEPAGLLQGPAQDLRVLYWDIVRVLEGCPFGVCTIYPVPPTTLKKHLTGRGNCKPEDKCFAVLTKLNHLLPQEYVVSDESKGGISKFKDAFDAVGLAALGHCYLGGDGYTKAQKDCLGKIKAL